ncbi:hypothetical protein [Candidatus Methylopumilus turicensis]|uniref:Uncharacterized protein n=1 Tax=Candidatus Methylopumilus turicensis TaxID=1581680 RepID=A0A0B7IWM2_9PROT|nr:hypothetical protein [Candidatus Methylopumilus turicensis]CEN56677.1 exported protein of unknown function [Candidatus Methylopumilus turicensis]
MTTATLAAPVVTSSTLATASQESFQHDSLQLGSANNLSFIEQLIIEQEVWSDTAYKTSNDMLYALLAKCYAKYEEMCADNHTAKKLRGELDDYIKLHSIAVNKTSHTLIKIVKCVFGTNKRRVSAYSIVLRTALFNKVKSADIADFVRNNGGVEEIRLAKNGNVLSPKQKAEAAKTAVVSAALAEFTSEDIAKQLDAANIGEQIVFVATQQADGKFVVNAVSTSATAVNAALAAYYSANKASINNQQDQQNTTTADAQLTNIVNNTNA